MAPIDSSSSFSMLYQFPLFLLRGFRVGYNSLCAYASVNHLHLHGWYLNHQIGIEFLVSTNNGELDD